MAQNENKPWERPWTTQEMIENASNWSLAGDSGLLKYLEDFSEKMLSKVKDTNDRLNDLIDDADSASLALQNATNQFMGLRNTQFIESRVYEDDETLPTKPPTEKEKPKPTKEEQLKEMKQAICNGLEIIDKYYEKVEIPESDSDDEGPNILYRPVDPYIDRPLPYVIGTLEWHKYWHVGLGHSSSDSEMENEEEQFSETESEEEIVRLPRTQIPGVSESESEDLPKQKLSNPVANSTFNDNTNRNMFDSSSDSETGSLPPQVHTVNNNFAEELAAKLGKVKSKEPQIEVNTKPIKKQPTNIAGGLFFDEPPPLDEEDIFVKKNTNSGLFSGGDNLFDDVDDDSDFWNVGKPTKTISDSSNIKPPIPNIFDQTDKPTDIFSNETNKKQPEIIHAKKPSSLFDDDDEDLFSAASLPQPKKSILAPFKKTAPLVSEEPPEFEPNLPEIPPQEVKKKKPVGGVSVLGPNALLQKHILKNRAPSSSESDIESEPTEKINFPKEKPVKPNKTTDLLNKTAEVLKKTEEESEKSAEIKQKTTDESNKTDITKITSIFDDTSPLFSDDIFNTSEKFTSNLFDSEPIKDDSLFKTENPKLFDESVNETNKKSNLFVEEPPPLSKKSSIFDNNDEDDLFSKPKTEKSVSKNSGNLFDDDLFNSGSNIGSNKSKIDLFDPNPPDFDESDSKSESQFSLENDYGSMNVDRALMFDTEPPMMSNESSGIVRDQSNSRIGEDSSFNPYFTSSSDRSAQFQDQSDSLLTGKREFSIPFNPENPTITKIDITPSGTESKLLNNSSNSSASLFEDFGEKNPENSTNLFKEKSPKISKKKTSSLFADSDSEEDIFSNSKNSTLENKNIFEDDPLSGPNLDSTLDVNIFKSKNMENSSSDEFNNTKSDKDTKEKFNYEENLKSDEVTKTDPKKSLSFEKNIEIDKKEDAEDKTDGQILSSGSSPGKLKHNLNINIAALLPGASPPKIDRSASLDFSENNQNVETTKIVEKAGEPRPSLEKSISFDQPVNTEEILASANKERVKIPVRRRPSSRKARQEAIRKSAIDLNFEDSIPENDKKDKMENILNIANNNIKNEEKIKNPLTNPLSPSTDEEDFLTMPREKDLSSENFENSLFGKAPIISPTYKENKNNTEPKTENLFDSVKIPTKEEQKTVETTKTKDFDPQETKSDDLFASVISTKAEQRTVVSTKTKDNLFDSVKIPTKEEQKTVETTKTKDLFEDFDAEVTKSDDLFASVKIPTKTVEPTKTKDLFEDIFVSNKSKTDTSIFSSSDSENDLFSTPKTELKKSDNNNLVILSPDEDLFKPVSTTTTIPKSGKPQLISREDSLFDEDDLFSTKKIPPKSLIIKKSLFDDEDDNDDDIFGASSSTMKPNTQIQSTVVKKSSAPSRLKKITSDTVQDIDDPLEAMKK